MFIWKLERAAPGYDEPNAVIVSASDELHARLYVVQELAQASQSVAAEFALQSTTVEKIGTANDEYGEEIIYAIESTDFLPKQ